MTANQIAYWNMQETKRANMAKETETERSNRSNESLKRTQNYETERSNKAQEALQAQKNRNDLSLGMGNLAVNQLNAATRAQEADTKERESAAGLVKIAGRDFKVSDLVKALDTGVDAVTDVAGNLLSLDKLVGAILGYH